MAANAITAGRPSACSGSPIWINCFCGAGDRARSRVEQGHRDPDGSHRRRQDRVGHGARDRLPVELISVDSAMAYRGMDIGTAKPGRAELARHPHHLIDIRDPAERYSVAEFLVDARRVSRRALGGRPCAAAGRRHDALFQGIQVGDRRAAGGVEAVRARLVRRAEREGLAVLHDELRRIDPAAAAGIHPNNPQRLLRALEVFETSGRPISAWWSSSRAWHRG